MADSIIQQLVHRKMFRITAGYLAVAWVLWQVVAATCPAFDCSKDFQQTIFWVLVAGLPITLAIAWAHWQTAILVGVGILAGATVMFLVMRGPQPNVVVEQTTVTPPVEVTEPAPTPTAVLEEKSIAVLPFVNMSDDREQGYFSDGISEEILNGLAKVEDLRVAARTSAFILRGQSIDVVGDKLNVNHVLEGSVRRAGDRLRITAQLIKVDDGFHLWSESYDRDLTDIFAVQDEIAKAVVDALKIELGVSATGVLVDIGTTSREAYDWYLRGKDALLAGTAVGYERSIEYFKRAIKIDPRYADAYVYLAYVHIQQHPFIPYGELAPAIKQAYTQALEINPSHSGALCAKGYEKIYSDWNWVEAGRLLRAAMRKSEFNNICSYISAWYLLPYGRFDEVEERLLNAELSDPLNLEIKNQLSGILFGGRLIDESIKRTVAMLDAAPDNVYLLRNLTLSYSFTGRLDKAEVPLERLENSLDPAAYQYAMWLRVQLEVLRDNLDKAQTVYEEGGRVAEVGVNRSPALPLLLGLAAVTLGHLDEAIAWLNRAFDAGATGITFVRAWMTGWPTYAQGHGPALMAHPDFQAFLKRMNLDDASMAALEAAEAGEQAKATSRPLPARNNP